MSPLVPIALRLAPGTDLRAALEQWTREGQVSAAFVLSGIGSLSRAAIRFAGVEAAVPRDGAFEILSLSGSLSRDGAHLHAALADATGAVFGGHLAQGNLIRTTAEILIARLDDQVFTRRADPATGYPELDNRRPD
jgi:hypothetical protein